MIKLAPFVALVVILVAVIAVNSHHGANRCQQIKAKGDAYLASHTGNAQDVATMAKYVSQAYAAGCAK